MYSRSIYSGNGSLKLFSVTFPYISKDHVEVRVSGIQVPFTWSNDQAVFLTDAPPAGDSNVDIRRNTPKDPAAVVYEDGSTLTDSDLNLETTQLLYLAQEAFDEAATKLESTFHRTYDAHGLRIENVGYPVNPGDAATKQYVQDFANAQDALVRAYADAGDASVRAYADAGDANTLTLARIQAELLVAGVVGGYGSFTAGLPGTIERTFQAKMRESISVLDFGVTGQGMVDELANLNKAVAAGVPLKWPAGTYRITGTLTCTIPQYWVTDGNVTIIYDAPSGSAAAPAIDFRDLAAVHGEFLVDHQAHLKNFTPPTGYNGNVISGSAVMVQGDFSNISDIRVSNAWDNGVSAIRLNPTTGAEVVGKPQYGTFSGIRTYNCGTGVHAGLTPGKIGAGIDVGSASAWVVANCVDYFSYIGYIIDTGAGAQASLVNCTAWYTQFDSSNPTGGSGYGFYSGSGDSSLVNCVSVGAGLRGFWEDGQNNDYTNCYAYIPQQEGWLIKGFACTLTNCRVKGGGVKQANTYDAFVIDCSARNITELVLDGCSTTGSNHRYGISATGGNQINALVVGGSITGTTGAINKGSYNIGLFYWDYAGGTKFGINRTSPGFELDLYGRMRVSANKANSSYATAPFGDSGSNGTVFIEDFATPQKRIAAGYDPVNDVGVIQAIQSGVAKKPLMLNPSGGHVAVGQGNLATGASDGFLQIPAMAGSPTGSPNLLPGYVGVVFDTTNRKIWVRSGSVWLSTAALS